MTGDFAAFIFDSARTWRFQCTVLFAAAEHNTIRAAEAIAVHGSSFVSILLWFFLYLRHETWLRGTEWIESDHESKQEQIVHWTGVRERGENRQGDQCRFQLSRHFLLQPVSSPSHLPSYLSFSDQSHWDLSLDWLRNWSDLHVAISWWHNILSNPANVSSPMTYFFFSWHICHWPSDSEIARLSLA